MSWNYSLPTSNVHFHGRNNSSLTFTPTAFYKYRARYLEHLHPSSFGELSHFSGKQISARLKNDKPAECRSPPPPWVRTSAYWGLHPMWIRWAPGKSLECCWSSTEMSRPPVPRQPAIKKDAFIGIHYNYPDKIIISSGSGTIGGLGRYSGLAGSSS